MAVPSTSPIIVTHLLCPACSRPMRQVIHATANRKFVELRAFCDTEGCQYGHKPTFAYAHGESIPYDRAVAKPKPVAGMEFTLPDGPESLPSSAPAVDVVKSPAPGTAAPRPLADFTAPIRKS